MAFFSVEAQTVAAKYNLLNRQRHDAAKGEPEKIGGVCCLFCHFRRYPYTIGSIFFVRLSLPYALVPILIIKYIVDYSGSSQLGTDPLPPTDDTSTIASLVAEKQATASTTHLTITGMF